MKGMDIDALVARLTNETDVGSFDTQVREREYRYFEAAYGPDMLHTLFSLDRLERLLDDECLLPCVDIYTSNHLKRLVDMQHKSGRSGLEVAAHCFRSRQTIRVRDLNHFDSTISRFVAAVQRRFCAAVQANLYLTPPHEAGFPAHFDTTDVFVIQLRGSKHWRIYADYAHATELPLTSIDWDPEHFTPRECYDEITLSEGDVLYLPRGVMHAATCEDRESMHLSISVSPATHADILAAAIDQAASEDVCLRRRVPFPPLDAGDDLEALVQSVRGRMLDAIAQVDVAALLKQARDRVSPDVTAPESKAPTSIIAEILAASPPRKGS